MSEPPDHDDDHDPGMHSGDNSPVPEPPPGFDDDSADAHAVSSGGAG